MPRKPRRFPLRRIKEDMEWHSSRLRRRIRAKFAPVRCYAGGDNKTFAAMGGGREKESAFPTRCTFPFGGTQGGESVLRKGECSFWVSVGKPPNLRAWGIMKRSDIRKSKKGCDTHQWWFAREVRACSLPGSIAKGTACTVPFAMLVER